MLFVEQRTNFNKNKMESEIKNSTNSFKETSLVLQLVKVS